MKKLILPLALASVIGSVAASDVIEIKDTRSGTSLSGAPASGVLLTRLGQTCSITEYKRSTDKPNEVALPVVESRDFKCNAQGDPI